MPTVTSDENEVTPEAAAALLRLALPTLLRLVERGELPGDGTRLPRAAVLAWRDRQATIRREALEGLARLSAAHDL